MQTILALRTDATRMELEVANTTNARRLRPSPAGNFQVIILASQ